MKILTWGIYLVIFCLPLYLVRFEIFGIPTTALEIMIYALFIIWLFNKFIRNTKYEIRATKPLFIPITLILLGVSLATVFSSDLRNSAGIWKAWFVDPILFFIILISVIKNFEQIKKILYSLFLSGIVVSVIALVYLILGKLDSVGRLQAFYTSPNYLAMYLAPALIIGFGLVTRKNIISNIFILLSIICLLLSLFFTYSYGAWLGIIAAIGFNLFFYLFKRNRKLIWVVICLGLIFILGLGYLKFNQPEADQSLNARLVIWQKAWEVFKANPIFGIGPGTFGNYFSLFPEWGVPQPHNLYLAFLLQTGLIGFIGFIWLLVVFFKTGFKNIRTFNVLNIILMSVMVYILVHGLVDTTYWKNDLSVLFWLIVGLMTALKSKYQNPNYFKSNPNN